MLLAPGSGCWGRIRPFLPDWAEHVCEIWRDVLDALQNDATRLAATLDWAIKHALFKERASRRGIPWSTIPVWTRVVDTIDGLIRSPGENVRGAIDQALVTRLRRNRGLVRTAIDEQTRVLADHELGWDDLDAFNALRLELWELDMRFGELGPRGIFAALDARDLLHHRMLAPDDWREAVDRPPADTRARVRGECVARWNRHRQDYLCAWARIHGPGGYVDLSDPFEPTERWQDHPVGAEPDFL